MKSITLMGTLTSADMKALTEAVRFFGQTRIPDVEGLAMIKRARAALRKVKAMKVREIPL